MDDVIPKEIVDQVSPELESIEDVLRAHGMSVRAPQDVLVWPHSPLLVGWYWKRSEYTLLVCVLMMDDGWAVGLHLNHGALSPRLGCFLSVERSLDSTAWGYNTNRLDECPSLEALARALGTLDVTRDHLSANGRHEAMSMIVSFFVKLPVDQPIAASAAP